jgi:hypothetical protein
MVTYNLKFTIFPGTLLLFGNVAGMDVEQRREFSAYFAV